MTMQALTGDAAELEAVLARMNEVVQAAGRICQAVAEQWAPVMQEVGRWADRFLPEHLRVQYGLPPRRRWTREFGGRKRWMR